MKLIIPSLILALFASSAIAVNSQPAPAVGGSMHHFGSDFTFAMPPHKMTMPLPIPMPMLMPPPHPPLFMELSMLIANPELNLTDDQISRLALIKKSTEGKIEQVIVQLHNLQKDYQYGLLANDKNSSSIRADILQQKAMVDSLMLDAAQEMVSVLTTEQKKQTKMMLDKKELFPFCAGRRVIFEKNIKCPKTEP